VVWPQNHSDGFLRFGFKTGGDVFFQFGLKTSGLGFPICVGTLMTGYPRVQASSQDNGSCLPTGGSSGAATSPHGSGSHLSARGSSGATTCHLGSSTHLLAQGSSRAAMCHKDGFCRLQASKQISPGDPAIMISIGACARISSKTLCDKGCPTCSHGVQQAAR
jgi:hypothetical protein